MKSKDMFNQSDFYGPDDLHRSHLSDARTWTHNDAIVTPFWQVITDVLLCALTTLAERVKLRRLRSLVPVSPTETIESAKMSTVAQMEETTKGRLKEANLKGQTTIRRL